MRAGFGTFSLQKLKSAKYPHGLFFSSDKQQVIIQKLGLPARARAWLYMIYYSEPKKLFDKGAVRN